MSNALFKKALQRITVFPPIFPPETKRRLVRRTGRRPKYREYVVPNTIASGGGYFVGTFTIVREPDGSEPYEYYEWTTEDPPAPIIRSPIVTPIAPAWDATARSGIAVVSPMAAEWVVGPGNVDMIVGLATADGRPEVPPAPPSGDAAQDAINTAQRAADLRATILHGFRIVGNAAYVHTIAPPEFGEVSIELRYSSLPVAANTVCRIEYARGVMRYLVDDVVMATGPAYVYEGQAVHMRAALYGTGDSLEDPALEQLPPAGDAAMTVAPIGIRASSSGNGGNASLNFALWANGQRTTGVRATLGGLWVSGGRVAGGSLMRISPFAVWGSGVQGNAGNSTMAIAPIMMKGGKYGEAEIRLGLFAFGRQEVPPSTNGLFGVASEIAASIDPRPNGGAYGTVAFDFSIEADLKTNARLPAAMGIRARSKANYVRFGRLDAALGFSAEGDGERVFDVAIVTEMGAGSAVLGLIILSANIDGGIGMSADLAHERITDALVAAGLGWDAGHAVQAIYSQTISALMGLGLMAIRDANDYIVWSVERGGASAAYAGFAFNSFARLGGRIFAAGDEGLYELGGQDDDGAPIPAWIDLGKRNFGSTLLKGISNAYLTTSSDGKMVVHVKTPDGCRYSYSASSADIDMRTQRVDFGHGLRATYLNLEVTNTEGGDFDLERLEFIVNESLKRRSS